MDSWWSYVSKTCGHGGKGYIKVDSHLLVGPKVFLEAYIEGCVGSRQKALSESFPG
jgi:hypothetical protein